MFLGLAVLLAAAPAIHADGCSMTFAKVAGFAPHVTTPLPLLYQSAYGTAITAECYNRCKSDEECLGFIVEYAKTSCYQVTRAYNLSYYRQTSGLASDPAVSYFSKVCLPVMQNCTSRAWAVDYVPGYELVDLHTIVIPNVDDRWACASQCVERRTSQEPCLSADFHSSSRTCTLSSHSRWTDPDAFIPTTQRSTDYIENQCFQDTGPFCWRDPVYNQSSIRTDLAVSGVSQEQCQARCEHNVYFTCRAYTFQPGSQLTPSQCHLHSDEALLPLGPVLYPQLTPTRGAVYVERISCVNLTVSCDQDTMKVTLSSQRFTGRLYVEGHSAHCGVDGQGQSTTVLDIPLREDNRCDIQHAFALARSFNKTLLTTIVIVQHHKLIQTVQDRVIKVTCMLTETSAPPSSTNNLTVGTSVTVSNPPPQTEVTGSGTNTTVGGNATTPHATMKIVDPRTGRNVESIDIGDPLRLEIFIYPPFNVSRVRAGHLVASSGGNHDSLLLLDWKGCPPNVQIFPGLSPADEHTLEADFKAFKFPSSDLLMLSVVLTFCPVACEPSDCGNGIISYGRRKRSVEDPEGVHHYEEMPLQVALVVRGPDTLLPGTTGPIISTQPPETSPLTPEEKGEVCMSFLLLALLFLFWFLVQCIIMALCCWYIGKREKEHADTISLRRDFQPPAHHVTWADQQDIPSARLRHSTVA